MPTYIGSEHPPALPVVPKVPHSCLPPSRPRLAGLMASFLFPEVSSVGSSWGGLAA